MTTTPTASALDECGVRYCLALSRLATVLASIEAERRAGREGPGLEVLTESRDRIRAELRATHLRVEELT